MAKAEIFSGVCGFTTVVEARQDGDHCNLHIESECTSIRRLAGVLTQVEPFREITFRGDGPLTLQLARKYCPRKYCAYCLPRAQRDYQGGRGRIRSGLACGCQY